MNSSNSAPAHGMGTATTWSAPTANPSICPEWESAIVTEPMAPWVKRASIGHPQSIWVAAITSISWRIPAYTYTPTTLVTQAPSDW